MEDLSAFSPPSPSVFDNLEFSRSFVEEGTGGGGPALPSGGGEAAVKKMECLSNCSLSTLKRIVKHYNLGVVSKIRYVSAMRTLVSNSLELDGILPFYEAQLETREEAREKRRQDKVERRRLAMEAAAKHGNGLGVGDRVVWWVGQFGVPYMGTITDLRSDGRTKVDQVLCTTADGGGGWMVFKPLWGCILTKVTRVPQSKLERFEETKTYQCKIVG